MTLGDLREQQSMTQEHLANLVSLKIPVSRSTLACWETGARRPSRPVIKRLAVIFNLPLSRMYRIVYGEDKEAK